MTAAMTAWAFLSALLILIPQFADASVRIAVAQSIATTSTSNSRCFQFPLLCVTNASVPASGIPNQQKRPPVRSAAFIKALADAHALLNMTDSEPKEVSVVQEMLKNSRVRVMNLPRGSKAWCPSLEINTTGYPREPNPLSLARAINSKYVMKDMTWTAAMSDDLASVAVGGIWWSSKQRPVPVTLVTQATMDRLPQLYSQCKSWKGPISALMYLGLYQQTTDGLTPENAELLRKASLAVADLFADTESNGSVCKLDVMLVYEVFTESRAMMLYPINVLRNLARAQARTPLLALVDVDMLLGSRLYQDLRSKPAFAEQIIKGAFNNTAYVLPAFETYGQTHESAALSDLLASKDKPLLAASVKKEIAGPFDFKRFPQGHNWTLFDRWFNATDPYRIAYGPRYEPWTIVHRNVAPWHDTRFRGYGQNKIVHIAHMNASGFNFEVLANAFIIHRSHEQTTARLRLVASKLIYDVALASNEPVDSQNIYGHTKILFDDAKEQMAQGSFQPVLDPASINCRETLSWWKPTVGGSL